MRLLEFNLDESGANPQHHPAAQKPSKPTVRRTPAAQKPSLAAAHQRARVFPVKTNTTRKPEARRNPIDLEQLQQRIVALELRIQERIERRGEQVPSRELAVLKQRIQLLERNVNSELWAAKQREYTMLQLLSKPTLQARIRKQLLAFRDKRLPVIVNWLKVEAGEWWQQSQPNWWPKLARAWQESLEQARR